MPVWLCLLPLGACSAVRGRTDRFDGYTVRTEKAAAVPAPETSRTVPERGTGEDAEALASALESGYTFGLWEGKYVGANELPYWSIALPMRRILETKVAKVANGFYGQFDRMGLFVFSKDDLGAADALKAMNYTLGLQKCLDNRYDRLYLADVNDLFACNLDDGISAGSRMVRYKISQEQRRQFYLEAVRRQR